MESLRTVLADNAALAIVIGGFIIGVVFGFIVARTNFCTMGSLSDIVNFGDHRRFRSWVLATGVAILGTQMLSALGVVDLSKVMYLAPNFDWLGPIIGGLMFGFGMVFAGGCASRNLVRTGMGDLRSLVVLLVMGIAAYVTIGGLIGPLRAALANATSVSLPGAKIVHQGLGAFVSSWTGLPLPRADLIVALVLGVAILIYCFKDARFRASPVNIAAGIGIGLCVVAGWLLTALAVDELAANAAPASLTFVRPTGDTLEWLQRYTAIPIPTFGVVTVLGTIVGAAIAALVMGRFAWATFSDPSDTLRNLFGAVLMGVGGVVALGCTIGQAVTGASTLAMGSFLAFAAIVAGGFAGLKAMERYA